MTTLKTIALLATISLTTLAAQADMVAYWSLDGATVAERLVDNTGNGHDLTEVGTSTWYTNGIFGNVMGNGSSTTRYLETPDANDIDFGTTSFSLSFRVLRTIAGRGGILDHLGTTNGYEVQTYNTNSHSLMRLRSSGSTINVDTLNNAVPTVADAQWANIVYTIDRTAGRAKVYVDGTHVTSADGTTVLASGVDISALGNIAPTQPFSVGHSDTYGPGGRVDDYALFDTVLTQEQVTNLAARPAGVSTARGNGLVQFDFTGLAADADALAVNDTSFVASGVTVTQGFTTGSAMYHSTANDRAGTLNWAGWSSTAPTADGTRSPTVELKLTDETDFDIITMRGWRNGSGAPDTFVWEASTDGGSNFVTVTDTIVISATLEASDAYYTFTILDGELENVTGDIIFRLQGYGNSTTGNMHISDLAIFADVPEPATMSLLAMGGLALLRRKRK